jgi:hypothetical protein
LIGAQQAFAGKPDAHLANEFPDRDAKVAPKDPRYVHGVETNLFGNIGQPQRFAKPRLNQFHDTLNPSRPAFGRFVLLAANRGGREGRRGCKARCSKECPARDSAQTASWSLFPCVGLAQGRFWLSQTNSKVALLFSSTY